MKQLIFDRHVEEYLCWNLSTWRLENSIVFFPKPFCLRLTLSDWEDLINYDIFETLLGSNLKLKYSDLAEISGVNVNVFSVFPNRWIGRKCAMKWSVQSSDHTPLGFFLWRCITKEIRQLTLHILQNVRKDFFHGLVSCQYINGEQWTFWTYFTMTLSKKNAIEH